MGFNQKINKLLLALNLAGVPVKLQRMMRYDKDRGRIVTSYVLYEKHPQKDGEFFGSSIALVQALAGMYQNTVSEDE